MSAQGFKLDRPTIGVLAGWSALEGTSPDHYIVSVIKGIQSAAHARNCNLYLSWEVYPTTNMRRNRWAWPTVSPESDFIPVGPWNTDGLIVFTPLQNDQRSLYIQKLVAQGHPILFIMTGEPGSRIGVDNGAGIRQAMAHLVEHGHHSIAFIAGVQGDSGDSQARLQAYHAAVAEHNLVADPGLVAWGWHNDREGHQAMQTLLKSGLKFTALMASNDNSAIGAMQAIREAGLRIPEDIAIVGFDDLPIAATQLPPLSSMRVPLRIIGEQALASMADHLVQQTPLESIYIPPRLIRRQSCGCIPEDHFLAAERAPRMEPGALRQARGRSSAQERKAEIVDKMLDVLPAELRFPGGDEIRATCTILVNAFYQSLKEMTPVHFQTAFIDWISSLEREDGNLAPWQALISILRREMTLLPINWKENELRQLADDLVYQACAAVAMSSQRQDQRHQYLKAVEALALQTLTAHLSGTLSEEHVLEILNSHLAGVGSGHARVMLFEAEQDDPVAWSVMLNADSGPARRRFLSREFPPPGLYPPNELLDLVLLPLIFQDEVLGYAAFEARNLGACAVIAIQLAATIKVVRLHAQVVELSQTDYLTGLRNRLYFELFLSTEVNRSQRYSHNLALIFVDVDNFKEYNDSYGHPAGDEALQAVASCLTKAHRRADIMARIGGDEFVIILPETDAMGALVVGRKIRTAVAGLTNLKRVLSVSIGLTTLLGSGMDAEALIKQADTALYESKRAGRSRISIYNAAGVVDEQEFLPGD